MYRANITYKNKTRISQRCAICGKEMMPCAQRKTYCKESCKKVAHFNMKYNTNYKTLDECKKSLDRDGKMLKGKIDKKPIMQFSLTGRYIRTIPTASIANLIGDENGAFNKNSLLRAARGERVSYRDYIWIYKEDFTDEILKNRISILNNRHDTKMKSVLVFNEHGERIARYNSISEGAEKQFVDRIALMRHLKGHKRHNTCGGYIWKYENN